MNSHQGRRDFDKEAASWDTPPRVKLAGDVAKAIEAQVPLSQDMDLLDVGCGTGLLSLGLRPHVRSVVGADLSSGMLDMFRHKIAAQGLKNVTAFQLESEEAAGISGLYHVIVMNMALHHMRDVRAFLNAAQTALHPGGYLAIADLEPEGGLFHPDPKGVFHNGFELAELRGMFRDAGFKDVRDTLAAEVVRPIADGTPRAFRIFLMTGCKG